MVYRSVRNEYKMKLITTIHNLNYLEKLSAFADGFLLGDERYAVRLTHSFDNNEMIDAIQKIHQLNKMCFILMNQMMTDLELDAAKKYIEMLPNDLIHGFIIADLGLIDVFKSLGLVHKVIYNPETLLTNYFDFNFLSNESINGAFVSKEITLEDIRIIGQNKAYSLFMYGHGHLSMFYSKRQILTAYTDYLAKDPIYHQDPLLELQEAKRDNENFPILEDFGGTHVFRGHVFQSLNDLSELDKVVDFLIVDTIFQDDDYAVKVLSLYQQRESNPIIIQELMTEYQETWTDGFLHRKTIYKGKAND